VWVAALALVMPRTASLMAAALAACLTACTEGPARPREATPLSLPVPADGGGPEAVDLLGDPPDCQPERWSARCADGFCLVPASCFMMGSPPTDLCRNEDELRHPVSLSRAFTISETEVTQSQFAALMGYNPSRAVACGPDCPVESVSWHEAAAFANALSESRRLPPCYRCSGARGSLRCQPAPGLEGAAIQGCAGYRLPTEAEWEHAYRAGGNDDLYNGPVTTCFGEDQRAAQIGWYRGNANHAVHAVRQKQPNGWGLFDMAGNVDEWVHDGYAAYPSGRVSDPCPPADEDRHGHRGGSWFLHVKEMRAAHRAVSAGTRTDAALGFRVVRSVP
jgi:formylglycine-generating enzyme required for sulfatase activity